jgi:hypothetical protein
VRIRDRYANVLQGDRGGEDCAQALAAYVRSLRSTTSPYNRFAAGDEGALSDSARRGMELFQGSAGCAECHRIEGSSDWASFRDRRYHNTGVAWLSRPVSAAGKRRLGFPDRMELTGQFLSVLGLSPDGDPGRNAVESAKGHVRAFKTPTLRDVARHPPYMHDGSIPILAEVVRHYAAGCGDDEKRDPRLRGFTASDADVADLVAFLEALTSEQRPGLAERAWTRRAEDTRLQFVDADGAPLPGLAITLTAAGDVATRGAAVPEPFVRITDGRGRIEFTPTTFTHVLLTLPQGLVPRGGPWVPDSCRSAKVVVPVRGTARVALIVPPGLTAPETLRLWRSPGAMIDPLPGANPEDLATHVGDGVPNEEHWKTTWLVDPTPALFVRQGSVELDGRRVALYSGWCPDAGTVMLFRLPGQSSPQRVTLEADTTVRVNVVR